MGSHKVAFSITLLRKRRGHWGVSEEIVKNRGWGEGPEGVKTASLGQNRTTVLSTSQQLWYLHTEDSQHGTPRAPEPVRSYRWLPGMEEEPHPWHADHAPVECLTPKSVWAT